MQKVKLLNRNKQRGIGLLELMLALGIISILIVMATRYYNTAVEGQRLAETYQQVLEIRKAFFEYKNMGKNTDYGVFTGKKGITILYELGLISKKTSQFKDTGGGTAFGPGTEFNVDRDAIWVKGIPQSACIKLTAKFRGAIDRCAEDDPQVQIPMKEPK
jgi:type II secretory pathway pseudopilin PulG